MLKPFFLLAAMSLSFGAWAAEDVPQAPSRINATLLAEVTPQGQKINGVALEYEAELFSGSDLTALYQVNTQLDSDSPQARTVLRAYSHSRPEISASPEAGKFVIVELDPRDPNAAPYFLKTENEQPISVRAKNEKGEIVRVEKVQKTAVPHYYQDRLHYQIAQTGLVKLSNGKTIDKNQLTQTAQSLKTPFLDGFTPHQVHLDSPANKLHYQLYQAKSKDNAPLTVFLHGSGQVGSDNLAQLLSSKGAISTLQYEDGFVLVPQYETVFDPFDDETKGQRGGVHWQTDNRIALLNKMIDRTLADFPNIDKNRIYIVGLSRGAEGGLNLLLNRPHFFAGALLMSGREAGSLDWIEGNATVEMLKPIAQVPIWFFHSKEDKVAPVSGSRINYQLLHDKLGAPVKYTEFSFTQAGDNGIINNNAHNSWDAVFNSPAAMQWLLRQKQGAK